MADILKIKKLIKGLKSEANKFKNNIKEVENIAKDFGGDTMNAIDKGVDFVKDFPKFLKEQLIKLVKLMGKGLGAVIGEVLVILFKIIWIILKETYKVAEKIIPYFWAVKYVVLVGGLMQIYPSVSIFINFMSLFVSRMAALISVYATLITTFFYIWYNFKNIYKGYTAYIADINYVKLVKDAVKMLAPEIAKLFEKLGDEVSKIF